MKTLNTWAASLALALFIAAAGGLMDGPSDIEAAQATQAEAQNAIDSVAATASAERVEARFDQLFSRK